MAIVNHISMPLNGSAVYLTLLKACVLPHLSKMRGKRLHTSRPMAIASSAMRTNAWTRGANTFRLRWLERAVASAVSMSRVRIFCRTLAMRIEVSQILARSRCLGKRRGKIACGGRDSQSTYGDENVSPFPPFFDGDKNSNCDCS
jgi:hypothetical protein